MRSVVSYVLAGVFFALGLVRMFTGPEHSGFTGAFGAALSLAWVVDTLLAFGAAAGWVILARRAIASRNNAESTGGTESNAAEQPKRGARWIPIGLSSLATALVVVVVGLALIDAGLRNAYSITVVDQESRSADFHYEPTGRYDLVASTEYICGDGYQFYTCIEQHRTMHNTVCVSVFLTDLATATCARLRLFIEEGYVRLEACGYGCETRADDGKWGWTHLRLRAETTLVSNGDEIPEISHREHCYFELGRLALGICPGRPG